MSKEIIKFGSIVEEKFNDIEVKENEVKGFVMIGYITDNKTKDIVTVQQVSGNKLDIVEVLILMLKDKKELEIQGIFEAVKEFI